MASEATRRPAAAGRPVGLKARASTVEYMQCHTMYYLLEIYRKETLLSVLCLFPPSPSSLALYTYSYKLKLLLFSRRAREAPERHDTRGKVYIVYIIIIILNIFHEKNIFTLIYLYTFRRKRIVNIFKNDNEKLLIGHLWAMIY